MVCEGNAVSPVDAQRTVACKYARAGQIVARTANGIRQTYEDDKKGQLLAVKDADGNAVERYAYDKAGNMLKKTVGGKTITFTFDAANQLVSSTTDGVTTRYAYDAAGRLVKEGSKTYTYGYLDKVMSVTEEDKTYTYTYHADGQLASANYGGKTEAFLWDGLALIQRGDEQFINEPHVGNAPKKLRFEGKPRAQRSARRARKGPRGNPVVSSKGVSYFNDMLGTTLGKKEKSGKYSAAALSAFGERLDNVDGTSPAIRSLGEGWFTGKPYVEGLGHAFLMRNYRVDLAKWQTADPMGYPDGWNQLAYCGNGVTSAVDALSLWTIQIGVFLFGGAATGVTIQGGLALGLSWEDGFSWGIYYNGGIGSEVGASASAGIVFSTTNSRNVSELAGQALSVGISAGEGLVVGVNAIIPLNIAETGYWGYDFSIGVGGGTPAEGHAIYNYTGFFYVSE